MSLGSPFRSTAPERCRACGHLDHVNLACGVVQVGPPRTCECDHDVPPPLGVACARCGHELAMHSAPSGYCYGCEPAAAYHTYQPPERTGTQPAADPTAPPESPSPAGGADGGRTSTPAAPVHSAKAHCWTCRCQPCAECGHPSSGHSLRIGRSCLTGECPCPAYISPPVAEGDEGLMRDAADLRATPAGNGSWFGTTTTDELECGECHELASDIAEMRALLKEMVEALPDPGILHVVDNDIPRYLKAVFVARWKKRAAFHAGIWL